MDRPQQSCPPPRVDHWKLPATLRIRGSDQDQSRLLSLQDAPGYLAVLQKQVSVLFAVFQGQNYKEHSVCELGADSRGVEEEVREGEREEPRSDHHDPETGERVEALEKR